MITVSLIRVFLGLAVAGATPVTVAGLLYRRTRRDQLRMAYEDGWYDAVGQQDWKASHAEAATAGPVSEPAAQLPAGWRDAMAAQLPATDALLETHLWSARIRADIDTWRDDLLGHAPQDALVV
jgi:hypothetical protein